MNEIIIWIGIILCISQSAIFSGLNLAFFSLSKLQLQVDAENGSFQAKKILTLRKDSNFLLTTILWGNVGVNVLLTLILGSVMAPLIAFIFSTIIITFLGEICPQAYFSRNSLRIGSFFVPVIRIYQFLLYPVAKPSAKLLDVWLGNESTVYLKEKALKEIISTHVKNDSSDVSYVAGTGAINFLSLNDKIVSHEGDIIDKRSIIALPFKNHMPEIPIIKHSIDDPFLKKLNSSGKKWVVITDLKNKPKLVLDVDACIRDALYLSPKSFSLLNYCHRPIFITNPNITLRDIIFKLKLKEHDMSGDGGVINNDVIILWAKEKRIITGSDLLGKLLKGI